METAVSPPTLQELRKQSGLTITEVVSMAREVDERFPRTHVGLLEIEERGTRDYWKIHALARVYQRPPDEIALIAKPG